MTEERPPARGDESPPEGAPPPAPPPSASPPPASPPSPPSASATSQHAGYINKGFVSESPRRRLSPAPPNAPPNALAPCDHDGAHPPRRKSILHAPGADHDHDGARAEGPSRRVSILHHPEHPQHGEGGGGGGGHEEGARGRKVSQVHYGPALGPTDATHHFDGPTEVPGRRKSILSQGSHYSGHPDGSEGPSRRVSIMHAPDHLSTPGAGFYNHIDGGTEGPIRRKSVLHNSDTGSLYSHFSQGLHAARRKSMPAWPESLHRSGWLIKAENGKAGGVPGGDGLSSKKSFDGLPDKFKYPRLEDRSWLASFCLKCRQEEAGEGGEEVGWEPPGWRRVCPAPFCPSYRQCARLLSLVLIGVLAWGVVYCIVGEAAAPGGPLFGLAALALLAHLGGWLISLTTLPPLVGMLLTGLLLQNAGLRLIALEYAGVVSVLRKIALVIILIRAGLDLDPGAMSRLRVTVLKLGLVPWLVECAAVAVLSHYLMDLPWMWGILLGSVISAVSPAVVVSCLFRLREKGYGVAKGIPTLIIAVSGIDDAVSVAAFGILQSVMFSSESLAYQIAQGPLSIVGGLGFGALWGLLSKFVPERGDPFVVPLRILMLFGGGLIAVFGSEEVGFGGAGPLGCIAAAFVACYYWSQQGWEVEDNPVATAFEIFWMIFEPILFGITGAQISFAELEGDMVSVAFACLITGIVIRIFCTVIVAIGSRLNLKEKFFVALAWMSKATVQAALGPVALDIVRSQHKDDTASEHTYARTVLVVCVLSILVTAPVGAIVMTLLGPRLLNKTTLPPIVEGWRRSARPSLRDITIIDEEEDGDGVAS